MIAGVNKGLHIADSTRPDPTRPDPTRPDSVWQLWLVRTNNWGWWSWYDVETTVWYKNSFRVRRGAPSSPARVSAHGGRDPGKPAWPEHFLKLVALIINELSLFGQTNNCACYKCWPNSNSVNPDVICQSEIIVNVSSMCGEAVCFVRRSLKKRTIGVFLVTVLYIFIHRFMMYNLPVDKQMPRELPRSFPIPNRTSM